MSDNGILAQIPGQYVGEGSLGLPPAVMATDEEHEVTIDAEHAGRVRIYYKRHRVNKGKHSHWFWLAVRAERVGGPAA